MRKRLFQTLFLLLFILGLSLSLNRAGTREVSAADRAGSFSDPGYTFQTIDGKTVSTKNSGGKTTVLIFGYTGCSKTRSTIMSIAQSDWVNSPNYRVVFAEAQFASLEEVQTYAESYAYAYSCYNIAFCYDDMSDSIMKAFYNYLSLYNGAPTTSGSFPGIVLIDQNSQVQKVIMEGKALTADQLKQELDQIGRPSPEPSVTPPVDDPGPQQGWADLLYSFQTIDGGYVPTTSKDTLGKTTVLLFGTTTCLNTRNTLTNIAQNSWAGDADIRVIFAEHSGQDQAATRAYAEQIGSDKITYCYDVNAGTTSIYVAMFKYAALVQDESDPVAYPLTVLIDGNNRIREILQGTQTAETLKAKIDDIAVPDPVIPDKPVSVPNVSGLKTASSQNSIKLTWNRTSGAEGYLIYQYKNSAWKQIQSVKSGKTASCTVKNLKTASNYRFAIKAYVSQDTKKITSKSYRDVYAATTPAAVTFKTTAKNRKVTLKWSKAPGATGYRVYYKMGSKGSWKTLKNLKGSSFTTKKLKSGKTYSFTVKAYRTYKGKTYLGKGKTKKVTIRK